MDGGDQWEPVRGNRKKKEKAHSGGGQGGRKGKRSDNNGDRKGRQEQGGGRRGGNRNASAAAAVSNKYKIRLRGEVVEDATTAIFLPYKAQLQWSSNAAGTFFVLDCRELFESRLPNTNTQKLAEAIGAIFGSSQKYQEAFSLYHTRSGTSPKFYLNFLKGCGPFVFVHLYNNPKHGSILLRYKKFADKGKDWIQFESTSVIEANNVLEKLYPLKISHKTVWVVQNRLKFSAVLCIRETPGVGPEVMLAHMRELPAEQLEAEEAELHDETGWVVPTGCIDEDQSSLTCAMQAFLEKTGYDVDDPGNHVVLDGKLEGPLCTYSPDYIELMVWHVAEITNRQIADFAYDLEENPDIDEVKWLPLHEVANPEAAFHEQVVFSYRKPLVWLLQSLPQRICELGWVTDWVDMEPHVELEKTFKFDIRSGFMTHCDGVELRSPQNSGEERAHKLGTSFVLASKPKLVSTYSQSTASPLEVSIPGIPRVVKRQLLAEGNVFAIPDGKPADSMVTETKYSPLEPLLAAIKAAGETVSAVVEDQEQGQEKGGEGKVEQQKVDEEAGKTPTGDTAPASGGVFVGLRFNLTQMAKTMTERSKEWLIQAEIKDGVIYMTKHHLSLEQLRTFSRTNNLYTGSCTEEEEEKNRFHAVVRNKLGSHTLFVGSPVQGVKPAGDASDAGATTVQVKLPVTDASALASAPAAGDQCIPPERFVLIKETTSRRRFYETWKLATWLQGFLGGIPTLRVGIVTDQNLVREDEMPMNDLVDSAKVKEKASVMLVFISEVLELLHRTVVQEGTTYFLYHASNEDKLQLFHLKSEQHKPSVAAWF